MRPATRQQTIFRRTIGICLIALALLGITSLSLKEIPLACFGERATGFVKQVEVIQTSTASKWRYGQAESRGGSTTIMHLVHTTKEGKLIESKHTATFHTEANVGDEHPLIYLPWHPERATIYSARQLWLPMIVGVIFSAFCLFLGLRCLSRKPFFPTPKGFHA
jgi:hypothetical protein